MSLVALVGSKGSPGVTTLACALGAVWPEGRDVVVVECDPSGGDIAARFGLSPDSGMTGLVLALRQGRPGEDGTVERHVQHLPGGLAILPGPVGGDAGFALDRELAMVGLASLEAADVIADCGRLDARSVGQHRVIREARQVLLVVRPEVSAIAQSRWVAERLLAMAAGRSGSVGLAVVGDGPFKAPEIAEALGVKLCGTLPRDPTAASMLCGQPGSQRVLARSRLMTTALRLVPGLVREDKEDEWRDAG